VLLDRPSAPAADQVSVRFWRGACFGRYLTDMPVCQGVHLKQLEPAAHSRRPTAAGPANPSSLSDQSTRNHKQSTDVSGQTIECKVDIPEWMNQDHVNVIHRQGLRAPPLVFQVMEVEKVCPSALYVLQDF